MSSKRILLDTWSRRIQTVKQFMTHLEFVVEIGITNQESRPLDQILEALKRSFIRYLAGRGHPVHPDLSELPRLIGQETIDSDNQDPLYRMKRVVFVLTGHTLLPPSTHPMRVRELNSEGLCSALF